jgi:hypothetical protein
MGPKGEPDTKTNWSTDCRPQDEIHLLLQLLKINEENIRAFTLLIELDSLILSLRWKDGIFHL